jgi:hypothetical protein
MRRPALLLLLTVALAGPSSGEVRGDYIATVTLLEPYLVQPGTTPALAMRFAITPDPMFNTSTPLFDFTLTPGDAGKALVADAASPYFNANVATLTNGTNDRVFLTDFGSGRGWYEAEFLYGTPHYPVTTPPLDLQGAVVNDATFKINSFAKVGVLQGDPPYDAYVLNATITFDGTPPPSGAVPARTWDDATWIMAHVTPVTDTTPPGVDPPPTGTGGGPTDSPEPAGICLGGIGVLAVAAWRRRSRR